MTEQSFSLRPFPDLSTPIPNLELRGTVARLGNSLALRYVLTGADLGFVLLEPTEPPQRKHELWQTTCFEFFVGQQQDDRYWEFNLSPAGHWNIYRFDYYRQGMQEEQAFASLPFQVDIEVDDVSVTIELDLTPLVPANVPLDLGVTAVIAHEASISYWALTHTALEADFHQRNSFLIQL